jgi:hypothetical protein
MHYYYYLTGTFTSGELQNECGVSTFTVRGGGIYRGEWDLHRLGEVGLAPGGGRAAKPHGRPVGWVEWPPPTRASPPRIDAWQRRLGLNCLKPWPTDQGFGLSGRHLGPLGLGFGPLGPRVKYTPMVMMILTFGQLHFVIPWNVPIWYLSS